MSYETKQVLDRLGDAAQQVAGRVIAVIDGKHRDIVTADGELTEFARSLLVDEPKKPGRQAKAPAAVSGDVTADLREMINASIEDEDE